jgi:hypothetical protein
VRSSRKHSSVSLLEGEKEEKGGIRKKNPNAPLLKQPHQPLQFPRILSPPLLFLIKARQSLRALQVSVLLPDSKRAKTHLSRQRLTRVQFDRLLVRLLRLDGAGEVELSEGEEDSAKVSSREFSSRSLRVRKGGRRRTHCSSHSQSPTLHCTSSSGRESGISSSLIIGQLERRRTSRSSRRRTSPSLLALP